MRVLHMSSEKGWRGGEQQLAYLLNDLGDKRVKNVLAVKPESRLEEHAKERKIAYYTLKFSNSIDIFSAYQIKEICRKEHIDLIHLHTSKAQGVGVLSTLCGNRIPMVLSRRVAFLPGSNAFSTWKYNHHQIKRIVCVSERVRTIMKEFVREGSKCVTVYSGIDLHKFDNIKPDRSFLGREFGVDPEKVIIGTVGAIDAAKDHFTFVDTIEKLVAGGRPVQGLIVGDGPLAGELKSYVHKKSLGDNIKFAGQRRDVVRLLPSLDIFLLTSKEEGLGTSILDAFLARIPVVATGAGGIPEIVRHEQTGLLAKVQDADELCENIIRLLEDGGFRQTLIEQAFVFVRKFSKEEASSKIFAIYQEVLSR